MIGKFPIIFFTIKVIAFNKIMISTDEVQTY